jgi:hypothetical protein
VNGRFYGHRAAIKHVITILHGNEYHVISAGKCVECVKNVNITRGAIHVKSELYGSDSCKTGITC